MKNKKKIYSNPVGESKYTGLFLIMPFVIGFILFAIYPFAMSFIFSFMDYNMNSLPEFIGLDNFISLLTDEAFHKAIGVTLKYIVILVPLKLVVSLMTAIILNMNLRGMGFFRTVYYIPSILGSNLSIVIMWSFLFTSDGLANQLLKLVGVAPVSWYGEANPAMWIIVFLRVWEFGSTMIIFLSALKDIPSELYDAVKVDGAGKIRAFFYITLPMLKNVIFVNLIIQTISAFQEFNAPFLITGGNPLKSTYTVAMLIYDEAFKYYNTGYANAISWMLFVMIAVVTLILFRITKKMREQ